MGNEYKISGKYELPVGKNHPFVFNTLVSSDGRVAWEPDTEQQHITLQYRDTTPGFDASLFNLPTAEAIAKAYANRGSDPIIINEVCTEDAARIVSEALSFKTKRTMPLEAVLAEHSGLIQQILHDFSKYDPTSPAYQ